MPYNQLQRELQIRGNSFKKKPCGADSALMPTAPVAPPIAQTMASSFQEDQINIAAPFAVAYRASNATRIDKKKGR